MLAYLFLLLNLNMIDVIIYISAQLIVVVLAGVLVYINFKNHFKVTDDSE